MIHCWDSIVRGRPRVEQAKTLHVHGVNGVSDSLIKIPRQIVRGVQLLARRLSCSRAAKEGCNQQVEHLEISKISQVDTFENHFTGVLVHEMNARNVMQ